MSALIRASTFCVLRFPWLIAHPLRYLWVRVVMAAVFLIGGIAVIYHLQSPREPVLVTAPFPERNDRRGTTPRDIAKSVSKIDFLVDAFRESANLPDLSIASDEVFLRRLYLDVAGRLPSVTAARSFLNSTDPKKRVALIDQLLDSESYVHGFFHFWADLLRHDTTVDFHWTGAEMSEWIKVALRENKPYDQFVYEILTAQGYAFEKNPVSYRIRDKGMLADHTVYTVRAFLGVDIRCAQCHDHPSEPISQREFYQLLSFFSNSRVSGTDLSETNFARYWRGFCNKVWRPSQTHFYRRAALSNVLHSPYDVAFNSEGPLCLPEDYQYDDAEPGSVVEPSVSLLGDQVEIPKGRSRREAFARWLIEPTNERFVLTAVHRLWTRLMSEKLIAESNRLDAKETCADPELLAHLQQTFVDLKFDVKDFLRILLRTRLYQSATIADDSENQTFAGHRLRRMSAEQIWDSLMGLVVEDLEERRGYGSAIINARDKIAKIHDMSSPEYHKWKNEPARMTADERRAIVTHSAPILLSSEVRMGEKDMWTWDMSGVTDSRWSELPRGFVRASELQSPTNPGHFLQDFGQSSRSLSIERPASQPSLQQVFHLLNGPVFEFLWNPQSVLAHEMSTVVEPADKIDVLYLAFLSRTPDDRERELCLGEFRRNAKAAPRRIAWALVNTPEFLFIE